MQIVSVQVEGRRFVGDPAQLDFVSLCDTNDTGATIDLPFAQRKFDHALVTTSHRTGKRERHQRKASGEKYATIGRPPVIFEQFVHE